MSSPDMIRLKRECKDDPARFNRRVLGRQPYWWRQGEICQSVQDYPTTLVPAGNSVGKSYCAAGIILHFVHNRPQCKVICTAPTQVQLAEVLWGEVSKAQKGSLIPLKGRVYKSPLKIDKGEAGLVLAYSTSKTERLSGHHATDLLAVIDEGSGVDPEIWEAIDSLNPSRLVVFGNPLRPDGPFYERCRQGLESPSALTNVIKIPSTDSPDIEMSRSHRGLADATWLAKARNDYGENSLWWLCHVKAEFPDSGIDSVVNRDWIDLAARSPHVRSGPTRTAIDLGEGNGGDLSVVLTRDDNGIIALEWSNVWSLEETASVAARHFQQHNVAPHRVTWDVGGIGSDFANRLSAAGIIGCQAYRGGGQGGRRFGNFRSAAAWHLRQRLDPSFMSPSDRGFLVPQVPFSIRPAWVQRMREELQGLRYELNDAGKICLERKEDFAKRLRHSPNYVDAFSQSFAFNN